MRSRTFLLIRSGGVVGDGCIWLNYTDRQTDWVRLSQLCCVSDSACCQSRYQRIRTDRSTDGQTDRPAVRCLCGSWFVSLSSILADICEFPATRPTAQHSTRAVQRRTGVTLFHIYCRIHQWNWSTFTKKMPKTRVARTSVLWRSRSTNCQIRDSWLSVSHISVMCGRGLWGQPLPPDEKII